MTKFQKIQLFLISIGKYIFFTITFILVFLTIFFECFILLITLGKKEIMLSDNIKKWSCNTLDNILQFEFKIIFKN